MRAFLPTTVIPLSALLRNEVIELIADEAGRGPEVAAATEAAMRGEVDFATSLRSLKGGDGHPLQRAHA
jgi:phosphoserine phosphatase